MMYMKPHRLLLAAGLCCSLALPAQVRITVDASQKGATVSPDLYGIFYEDINHAADGGIYAELVRNRSFEDNAQEPEFWHTDGQAQMRLVKTDLLNKVQQQALQVTFTGKGILTNDGFWGMNAVSGQTYRLSFWAKGKVQGGLKASLVDPSRGNASLGSVTVKVSSGKWKRYTAVITATGSCAQARLQLTAGGKGEVALDMVSLFPPTYKNRDNGLRPDLVQRLADLRPRFFRFPGGCFVEGQLSPDNAFRWQRTVGPVEERPGHMNVNWGYRTTDGLGFHEYLQLAEDLGAKPLYVVNVGIWHGGFTPVDSIQPWIQEALDALEYANGPVTSKFGAMRAANGHPEPFNIEYLEIGNENNQPDAASQSDRYYERFKLFKDAILARYPNMHLIGNVVAWGDDNPKWGSSEPVELIDEHYYRSPSWFTNEFRKYDSYDRRGPKIYVGEYAVTQSYGSVGNLNAALGEAVFMMGMENNADIVRMASYAPIFVNVNNQAWMPDMIRFDASRLACTPSYYVQQLMPRHLGTRVLNVEQQSNLTFVDTLSITPAVSHVGVGTYATQATYEDQYGNRWSNSGTGTPDLKVFDTRVSGREYTYKVRARKDGGNEGFLIVVNHADDRNFCWVNIGGWNNTQSAVEQTTGGGRAVIATAPVGGIENGRWYDIAVTVRHDSIFCQLDGKDILAAKLVKAVTPGVFSSATLDEATGNVIVKVVNTSSIATEADVDLKHFSAGKASVVRLTSASGEDENTLDNPHHVVPTDGTAQVSGGKVKVKVPACSLNIVTIEPAR
jgi:alpha-L-arabinofuranosidase